MNERKTVHKWFWVWEFEKEEAWLNAMAMDGWVLDGIGFATYHFVRCQPGEYIIRLQMTDNDTGYQAFLEEIGAEYVGRITKWGYFRRKAELGEFELFSDIDSKTDHLKKIGTMLKLLMIANLCIGIANSLNISSFGIINLLCAALLAYGLGRIDGKLENLNAERLLHE